MTPACLAVAARIVQWGFKVYLPLFFGRPNEVIGPLGYAGALFCVRHEFNLLTRNGDSPIAEWLRELCRRADKESGQRGIGLIGMCLTGNIVLSVMLEPAVRVPVMCEPALPFGHADALGIPEMDISSAKGMAVKAPIMAYRFSTDKKCPAERFNTLRKEFGSNIQTCEIETLTQPFNIPRDAHSVLTGDYPEMDDPNHPVNHAFDEILSRFRVSLPRI
jgi:dienelactone hydrolase